MEGNRILYDLSVPHEWPETVITQVSSRTATSTGSLCYYIFISAGRRKAFCVETAFLFGARFGM